MKKIMFILTTIFILTASCMLLTSCESTEPRPFPPPSSKQTDQESSLNDEVSPSKLSPVNISVFSSAAEGEWNRFYFMLEDENGRNITSSGNVKIEIFDDVSESLYLNEFKINESEFVDYEFKLTGQHMGKAYEWRIPISEIDKGISTFEWGRAVLSFTTLKGKELHAEDTMVQIPVFTEEELQQISENEYMSSAIVVGQKINKGIFEINVLKAGFFSPYEWGEKKGYFRVDMEIKNVGNESDYFSPNGLAILDNKGNQYENTYGGTLDTFSQIYPGVTKKGYIIFEGIPDTIAVARLVFELGYDEDFNPYLFDYTIQLAGN